MQYNIDTRLPEDKKLIGFPFTIFIIIAFVASIGFQYFTDWGLGGSKLTPKPSNSVETVTNPYRTKSACFLETVVLQNKCWIIHYSNIYGVDTETSLRIAFAESSFNPLAVNYNTNGTRDLGTFQINDIFLVLQNRMR